MGKTNAWITFAKKTYADMKRTNKNVSYSDALKVAGKKWKSQKRGGAMYRVGSDAATVKGGADEATDLDADAAADELDAAADMVRASVNGGKRSRRKSTKRKTRRGGKCCSGGKKRRRTKRRR